MIAHLLIIEDAEDVRALLRYNLEREGYAIREAVTGEEALLAIAEMRPDAIILDWMIPSPSGIEVCRILRAKPDTKSIPILMLTARGEEEDRVRGLKTGADDYLTKPFSVREILARIQALLRRAYPEKLADRLQFGDILLDRTTHRVSRGGVWLHLGPIEYRLLNVFFEHPRRVLNREQLLHHVWGDESDIDLRTVDVHVGRLRKILNSNGGEDVIRTVRAAGYAIDLPEEAVEKKV